MTTVPQISQNPTSMGASRASSAPQTISDYQTFLKLMTTQLLNQDPTDPLDSADYAVQLATFSQVEQQVKTNDLLTSLNSSLGISGISQYANWVGMEARAAVSATFDGASPITLVPEPASGADQAVLVVKNATGAVVDRQAIAMSADTLDWVGTTAAGGQLPAGSYSFALESYSNGALVSSDAVDLYSSIAEVRQGDTGTVLVTASGAEIPVGEVFALRDGT